VPDLYESEQLKRHYNKLLSVLENVIDSLGDPKNIGKEMKELGRRHVGYRVKIDHYNVIGKAILKTVETFMGREFTSPIKHSWIALIR